MLLQKVLVTFPALSSSPLAVGIPQESQTLSLNPLPWLISSMITVSSMAFMQMVHVCKFLIQQRPHILLPFSISFLDISKASQDWHDLANDFFSTKPEFLLQQWPLPTSHAVCNQEPRSHLVCALLSYTPYVYHHQCDFFCKRWMSCSDSLKMVFLTPAFGIVNYWHFDFLLWCSWKALLINSRTSIV